MFVHLWYQSPAAYCGPPVAGGTAPVNTLAPSIADITPTEGEALTVLPGDWIGTAPIVFSYQWRKLAVGVTEDPPVNTLAPSIADITPTEGEMLTVVPGTWIGTAPIVLSYQWAKTGGGVPPVDGDTLTDELGNTLLDELGNALVVG